MDIKKILEKYKKKGIFRKEEAEKRLAKKYMEKARKNLISMQIDFDISKKEEVKKVLGISEDFTQFEWVMIKGYYAMYHAALACLAKLGFKSESHEATVLALDLYFVQKRRLEEVYAKLLKAARLEKEYIEKLREAREERVVAQYGVSEEVERRSAEWIIKAAKDFVDRMEKLFDEIK